MKVLLIDPPFYRFMGYYNRYFPLGLASLAAVLRQHEFEVLVYDADSNVNPSRMNFTRLEDNYPQYLTSVQENNHPLWQELKNVLNIFSPDLIGITVWTTFAASSFRVATLCKSFNPQIPIVMGGPHVTVRFDEVMRICPAVDFLVRGEGEKTFLTLVNVLRHKPMVNDLAKIAGISYRNKNEIIHNPADEFIKDLDTIPFPARDLLRNIKVYDSEDMGLIMTSRGCPYNCSYCATSIWERKTRYRSVENVVNEIKFVINEYGTRQFTFKDDSFTVNRKRVLALCDRLIDEKINISWECNTRVNLVDEEILKKMNKAGCNSIKVGIETGSERIMRLMNKNITFDQCRNAAKLFRKVGIHWTGYFMMGLPSETKEETLMTLKFMQELNPDFASFSVYEPFPGTNLFDLGVTKGLVQPNRTLTDFYTISPKYYYVKDINQRVDTMSNQELERLESQMKLSFNRHNQSFFRLAKRGLSRSKLYVQEPVRLGEDLKKMWWWLYGK